MKKIASSILALLPQTAPIKIELWADKLKEVTYSVRNNDFLVLETEDFALAKRTYIQVVDHALK